MSCDFRPLGRQFLKPRFIGDAQTRGADREAMADRRDSRDTSALGTEGTAGQRRTYRR